MPSVKSNISKDLKQALIRLCKPMMAARKDHKEPVATAVAAELVKLKDVCKELFLESFQQFRHKFVLVILL